MTILILLVGLRGFWLLAEMCNCFELDCDYIIDYVIDWIFFSGKTIVIVTDYGE